MFGRCEGRRPKCLSLIVRDGLKSSLVVSGGVSSTCVGKMVKKVGTAAPSRLCRDKVLPLTIVMQIRCHQAAAAAAVAELCGNLQCTFFTRYVNFSSVAAGVDRLRIRLDSSICFSPIQVSLVLSRA